MYEQFHDTFIIIIYIHVHIIFLDMSSFDIRTISLAIMNNYFFDYIDTISPDYIAVYISLLMVTLNP